MYRNGRSTADDSAWDTATGHKWLFYASKNFEGTLQNRVRKAGCPQANGKYLHRNER